MMGNFQELFSGGKVLVLTISVLAHNLKCLFQFVHMQSQLYQDGE
jgi:hypothetical protein